MKIIKAAGVKPPAVTGTLKGLPTAQDQKQGDQLEGRLRTKLHLPKFRIQKYEQLLVQSSEFKIWWITEWTQAVIDFIPYPC